MASPVLRDNKKRALADLRKNEFWVEFFRFQFSRKNVPRNQYLLTTSTVALSGFKHWYIHDLCCFWMCMLGHGCGSSACIEEM